MSNVVAGPIEQTVNDFWWAGTIQATLALFFGITALFWPGLTLVVLTYLFSAFVLGLGIVEVVTGFMSRRVRSSWWATALLGVIGIGIGVFLVRHPNVSFGTLIVLIGIAFIARGLFDIVRIFVDRADVLEKMVWSFLGALGIIAGILILYQPVAGGVAFVWIVGLYSVILGTMSLVSALALRESTESYSESAPGAIDGPRNSTTVPVKSRRRTA